MGTESKELEGRRGMKGAQVRAHNDSPSGEETRGMPSKGRSGRDHGSTKMSLCASKSC